MPLAPEPVLDVVRALSTVASFSIVLQQLKTIYDTFFVTYCDRCRGTGIVTCPHCHGTKDLRVRPGFLRTRSMAIIDNPKHHYLCYHCGPTTVHDMDPFALEDAESEATAIKIMDNLKAAVANKWPKPHDMPVYAGTVSCPDCLGSPKIKRLTPDFSKAFGLQGTWDSLIYQRMGRSFLGRENVPRGSRLFLEYPASAPEPIEKPPRPSKTIYPGQPEPPQQSPQELEKYVLPFASDDEE